MGKDLNKVFHTAFKVVFQKKEMDANNGQAATPQAGDDSIIVQNTQSSGKEGGCCGGKKK